MTEKLAKIKQSSTLDAKTTSLLKLEINYLKKQLKAVHKMRKTTGTDWHCLLCCRAIVDDVGERAMPEHSVL